jgi:anaerobic selenocysteine-containing dehydrogenase
LNLKGGERSLPLFEAKWDSGDRRFKSSHPDIELEIKWSGHPWLKNRIPYPQLQIHPDAAKERGSQQGDKVVVETPRGSFKHVAELTEDVHPQVVNGTFGWWLPEGQVRDGSSLEVNINATMSYDPPYDPVVGINSVQNLMCQVSKA